MKKQSSRWLLAALSPVALAASIGHAQTGPLASLPDTVVTASRIPEDPSLLPIGVQVITGDQIRAAGVTNARDAIRWLGGVVGRSDTQSGREPPLDLRGFGETAASNTVILVDGVRQNEGDMNPTVLSWVPVDSIERIEIVRGSGAVLHGEGATAGVIHIITAKGLAEPGGSVSLAMGSNATRDARLSLNTSANAWRYQIHANAFDTDNHRQSFNTRERNVLGRATWSDADALLSVQVGGQSSSGNQPGGLTPADFLTRPQFAYNRNDTSRSELQNLLVSAELPVGAWRVAADINHRRADTSARVPSFFGFSSDTQTASSRGGVRAWRNYDLAGLTLRSLAGLDAETWEQTITSNFGDANVKQDSTALYVRQEAESRLAGVKGFVGVRRTVSDREALGTLLGTGGLTGGNTSWELGAAKRAGSGEFFTKTGTSFRLPNASEYTCFDGDLCQLSLLRPQTSKDFELGYRWASNADTTTNASVRYYLNELKNEIGFIKNPAELFGSNRNFDPTRRDGVEIEAKTRLSARTEAAVQYARRRAVFTSGDFRGSDIPLVARQSVTARWSYRQSDTQQWLLITHWVSSQRIGDDYANLSAQRVPSYALVNVRYNHRVAAWTFSASVNNALDRAYYSYRTNVDDSKKSVYPEAGRTFLVSAQRRF